METSEDPDNLDHEGVSDSQQNDTSRTATCSKCHKTFSRAAVRRIHEAKCSGPKNKSLTCQHCNAVFTRPHRARAHEAKCSGPKNRSLMCQHCDAVFARPDRARAHESKCTGPKNRSLTCKHCDTVFTRPDKARVHESKCTRPKKVKCTGPEGTKNQTQCKKCGLYLNEDKNMGRHLAVCKGVALKTCTRCDRQYKDYHVCHKTTYRAENIPSRKKRKLMGLNAPLTGVYDDTLEIPEIPKGFKNHQDVYVQNWASIRDSRHIGKVQSVYNIRLVTSSLHDIVPSLNAIFHEQAGAFKVNASFGSILRDLTFGRMRYFHSCQNNAKVFDMPITIESAQDFEKFIATLESMDFIEQARQTRPNTKSVVEEVTNVTIYVNHMTYVIKHNVTPEHIKHRQGVVTIDSENNMCFFHALAVHKDPTLLVDYQKTRRLKSKKPALELYKQYTSTPCHEFQGVSSDTIDSLENFYKLGIRIYSLEKQGSGFMALLHRRPNPTYEDIIDLDLSESSDGQYHFSLVYDLKKYSNTFKCGSCGQRWPTAFACTRHERTCDRATSERFSADVYKPTPTIFAKMERLGFAVPKDLQFYPFRTCYDFEAYFIASESKYKAEHVPMSFSLSSNIPGYEESEFVTSDNPDTLLQLFTSKLNAHSDKAFDTLASRYSPYLEQLQEKADHIRSKDSDVNGKNPYDALHVQLLQWLRELPVIGFNSGRYDMNLVKIPLMTILNDCRPEDEEAPFKWSPSQTHNVVKKDNAFMSVTTERLRFLDITNYLTPGTSLTDYLQAFQVEEKKGWFPYEYVRSYSQLNESSLPPYEAFYSELNNCNPLDEGVDELVGRANHAKLQALWIDHGWTSVMCLLKWYNNLDTSGFIQALDKQFEFFRDQLNLDMFKEAISLPGLSLKYAFDTAEDAEFHLYGEKFRELHKLLRRNVVGGPSIIFHRYHEAGVTKIREMEYGIDAQPVKSVLGLDANALYLWAFGQKMPTGTFIVRHGPAFKKEKRQKAYSTKAVTWLESLSKTHNIKILHALNGGEIRIGGKKTKVDGFCPETDTIYEYHGCHYHGCRTCKAKEQNEPHPYHPSKTFAEIRQQTADKTQYLKDLGYTVVEQWECEDKTRQISRASKLQLEPTEAEIIEGVKNDTIFGYVEVDIRTPDHLKDQFADFPPLFKNTNVSRDDIGEFMQAYCQKTNVLKHPTSLLISSYFAEKIVLITPLLKYYLNLGLEVTHIHQLVEYNQAKACFSNFVNNVSDARREGDKNVDSSIVAECFKLVGNSAYGKSLQNIGKQTDLCYTDRITACHRINSNLFKTCTRLSDSLYEIECMKARLVHKLPIQLGFFVYQYAKLRMLQLQYDFMEKYLHRTSYQLVEMDTDSSYFALSTENLEDAVIPELKQEFYENYNNWFPAQACEEHYDTFVSTKMNAGTWTQLPCCKATSKFQKRTPGLFKTEFKGLGIIALCSKTYICWNADETKVSCKGVQKKRNALNLTRDTYLNVLRTQIAGKGINKGFRTVGGKVYTYEQERHGLSYTYPKRKVLADGITTIPLDL